MDVEISLSHLPTNLPPRDNAALIFNALSNSIADITQTQTVADSYFDHFSASVIDQIKQAQPLYPNRDDFPQTIDALETLFANGKEKPRRNHLLNRLFRP